MAEDKPKPRRVGKQRKGLIYQTLCNLNAAFETIGREIEVLDDHETIAVDSLWLYRVTAEELRAGMNHRILGVLTERELREWTRLGKELRDRQQQEQRE